MAIKKVIRMGHPVLRQKAAPVPVEEITTAEFKQLIQDMFDTMNAEDGIGIAAPQIGVAKQVAIIGIPRDNPRYPDAPEDEDDHDLIVVVNPKIKVLDETKQGFWEGCLSVPGLRGYVERPREIEVEFHDLDGNVQVVSASDFIATIFQHEIDHLEGKLYVDRIEDKTKLAYIEEFMEFVAREGQDD